MTAEEWRGVAGWPGYEVSNLGRVRSHRSGEPRIMQGGLNVGGYRQVTLSRGKEQRSHRIHRMVADAFLGPEPEVPPGAYRIEVCHNNGNRTDNRVENLRYDTNLGNQADSIRHGTHRALEQKARTHCPQGHEYTEENTYRELSKRGYVLRSCKACNFRRQREYMARKRAKASGAAA